MVKKSYGKIRSQKKQSIDAKKVKKLSSQMWVRRQLNDVYVQAAKKEGYYARSAYKLIEINDKYKIIKPKSRIIDLGAAPGGWSQVVSKIIGSNPESQLIAVDLLDIKFVKNAYNIKGDFTDPEIIKSIYETLNNNKVFSVLSDMAPNTTGYKSLDHFKIINLVEIAYNFAISILEEGGSFVAKVFQGGTEKNLLAQIKQNFKEVHHFKPPASRKESKELYLVAKGFKSKN